MFSRLDYGSLALRPAALLALLVGADQILIQPTRTFTSGLPTVWSPAPSPDITTVPTGQFALAGLSPTRTSTSFTALTGRSSPVPRCGHRAEGWARVCSVRERRVRLSRPPHHGADQGPRIHVTIVQGTKAAIDSVTSRAQCHQLAPFGSGSGLQGVNASLLLIVASLLPN